MKAVPKDLADLFEFDPATLRVVSREGKHREFERQQAAGDVLRYGGTLAASSDTDGGVIVLGVTDASLSIVGIDDTFPDQANRANSLRNAFAPKSDFAVREYIWALAINCARLLRWPRCASASPRQIQAA